MTLFTLYVFENWASSAGFWAYKAFFLLQE